MYLKMLIFFFISINAEVVSVAGISLFHWILQIFTSIIMILTSAITPDPKGISQTQRVNI